MGGVNDLSNLDVDEVSIVKRGAIRRVFSLFKADDDGSVELEKATVAALAAPLPDEAEIVEALKADGLDGAALEAAVAAKRLEAFVKAAKKKPADDDGDADEDGKDDDGDEDDVAKDGKKPPAQMGDDGEWSDEMDADAMPDADEIAKAAEHFAKKDYSTADRKRLAAEGKALSDGSYPIDDADDLKNAATLAQSGHGDVAAAKRLIARRAAALGVANPLKKSGELASVSNATKERSMGDAPAAPVMKEDGTWDLSGVDPANRGFYDSVLKSLDDAEKRAESLAESVKKAEERSVELETKLIEKELIQKAEGEFSHIAKSDELVPVLKAAKESMDAEAFSKLEAILKAASAKIEAGDLFAEFGERGAAYLKEAKSAASVAKAAGGDAWDKIEAGAEALVEKSAEPISKEKAIDAFLKTEAGKALYVEYAAERGTVVA